MCDYSLGLVNSRPARVGDRLVSTGFKNTVTRGLSAVDQPDTAVCLLPGTEVVFDRRARYTFGPLGLFSWRTRSPLARFRQINTADPHVHHDALEFADGRVISLQSLALGQRASVLQLPAEGQNGSSVESRPRPAEAPALAVQVPVAVQG
jgi:hypothetical protein